MGTFDRCYFKYDHQAEHPGCLGAQGGPQSPLTSSPPAVTLVISSPAPHPLPLPNAHPPTTGTCGVLPTQAPRPRHSALHTAHTQCRHTAPEGRRTASRTRRRACGLLGAESQTTAASGAEVPDHGSLGDGWGGQLSAFLIYFALRQTITFLRCGKLC